MISYAELEQLYDEAMQEPLPDIVITRTQEDANWLRATYPEQQEEKR